MKVFFAKSYVVVMFSFLLSMGAIAEAEQAGGKKSGRKNEHRMDAVTVTAQKTEENVQEVPMSITVFADQKLEDKRIESVSALSHYVPNLMMYESGGPGASAPVMRGISASLHSLNVGTGLYVDGIPVLNPFGFENEMLDIERIEVLRGPQGTLYGKGTEAGVISIITRQPDNHFRGRVSAEGARLLSGETGDRLKTAVAINLSSPIKKDSLFLGFAGKYYQKDGFMENTLTGEPADDREHWYGRAHLRWTPTDKFDISLIATSFEYHNDAVKMNLGAQGAAMFMLPPPENRKISSNLNGKHEPYGHSQVLKIAYDISDRMTLTSVTANWVHNDNVTTDWDFSPQTLMHISKRNDYSRVSQELRLDHAMERFKWLIGLYYDKNENEMTTATESMRPGPGRTSRDVEGDAYAVFGNCTYQLTPAISIVAGLRYENEEQEFEDNITNAKREEDWDSITPKIALQYAFTPTIMAYVSASKGYRSGGFNLTSLNPLYYSYDPEELWSYEIGMKSAFLNNRLIINGSVYYMDITDMQVDTAVSPSENYVTNAAEASSIGIELELMARVFEGFDCLAGFGYNDIEFDEFKDARGDYKGNNNPYAPQYTFNLGAQYRHHSGFFARADLIGYGKMYFDKTNRYSRDAYEIVNTKIGYEFEHIDFYLYAKNLFDQEYNSDGYFDGFYTIYSDPGEAGIQVVYRF